MTVVTSEVTAELIAVTGGPQVDYNSALYRLDIATGTATKIGETGLKHVTGIAVEPTTGLLFAHRNDDITGVGELYRLDLQTASPTLIGTTGVRVPDISFGPDGNLYGWMEFGSENFFKEEVDDLVTFDLNNGSVTRVGESGIFTNQTGLAFAPNGSLFLKSGDIDASKPQADRVGHLYQIDPVTGVGTSIIALDAQPHNGLDFDASGQAYTFSRGNSGTLLQTIDFTTGHVTDLDVFDVQGITAIAFVTAVPEPSSLILISTVSVGLVMFRRRRS
ncbi:PEP-CTERM sorting domain-containing protein [Rubripirellula reticaptiva]|uniref:PEP-CTERM sorting domain-containing protein n=1 Tax=Rubripirellula reticaptiva TaxID=2528013 RepID=UPI0016444E23|nr:PEP-CTERM sorting domain-containing protein [Rubripirellula reticaptiva]